MCYDKDFDVAAESSVSKNFLRLSISLDRQAAFNLILSVACSTAVSDPTRSF